MYYDYNYPMEELVVQSGNEIFTAYLRKNPKFSKKRKTDFGKLSLGTIEFKGEEQGRWYSVDSHGRVRTHTFVNAGMYVSIHT